MNYWDASGDEVFAVALSPVFVLSFGGDDSGYHPYIEGGIGAALLSDHAIAGRQLSTTFQFEDRIGFGVRSDRFDFHYRYMHYSNGGIEKPNNGIDAHLIGMAFKY
jgi:lipid A 3-O-deacylase